ncbi:SDR family NAD(P)-dependent oxidoreductase [Sulfitobacter mediterraneus]|uniref:SDR family NAD(P)-dependent oxidoreductase n=1 Tax=Sulfitobacter mediterraneus TaxID=83219 RepID=UPI00193AB955|nr:SDR family NAD(P)-dependent oxidoreductase [Sulfitobacter mediterraneus]MBM1558109.1 SDR family NAD(P)-dependent oxidoreductase [Sulfitobacter mediterraneus]MBM1570221.1 SDR family NAD(P)-dependent oxidoreductase [Sulfitobacter mediterraneus]MBM1573315.1 SDR family NAD(P)-dependent oxidoreductase [Sulfitobacter mediterraneus]MBM1577239.1 SDR family NAD(P)-dependent oxidoreductase [Sulfitobacter mediterraneus]MBM1581098.1 SDR family NAD(P)-dependent oxidoreductase [Sulfitobacter mediterraneu
MTHRTAIITGGAGGLGLALDNALRSKGWHTVLVDLPGPALDALQDIEGRHALPCDLTDSAALSALCAQIRDHCPTIDLVIYNAGVTHIGPCAELTESTHRKVFDINYFAATRMAQELQADLRKSNGTHLAISSVAGFSPLLHRTAYAASKHALEGFFKSLRAEEAPHDVRVVIAAPSFVATNLGNAQAQDNGIARPGSATDGVDYMSPDDAAKVILNGLERGKPFVPVGRIARLSYLINRASPALFEWLMRRKMG